MRLPVGNGRRTKKRFAFRGDSNWLGFSKCANKDVLAGWCESGSIFVADVVQEQVIEGFPQLTICSGEES